MATILPADFKSINLIVGGKLILNSETTIDDNNKEQVNSAKAEYANERNTDNKDVEGDASIAPNVFNIAS